MAGLNQASGPLLACADSLAATGSEMLRRHLGTRHQVEAKSSVSDIVTEVDRAIETELAARLAVMRPDDGLLSEEGHTRVSRSGITWVIDPIDGTANFANGLAPHMVSVAACDHVDGYRLSTVVGVLSDPVHGEVFRAVRGAGATLNGRSIEPPNHGDLRTALVGTGFSHTPAVRQAEAAALRLVLPAIGDLRRSGSGATDLCWVAAGRLDAFYQMDLKPWDYAAASLVVSEAGGSFSLLPAGHSGEILVTASSPNLTADFDALLEAAGLIRRRPETMP